MNFNPQLIRLDNNPFLHHRNCTANVNCETSSIFDNLLSVMLSCGQRSYQTVRMPQCQNWTHLSSLAVSEAVSLSLPRDDRLISLLEDDASSSLAIFSALDCCGEAMIESCNVHFNMLVCFSRRHMYTSTCSVARKYLQGRCMFVVYLWWSIMAGTWAFMVGRHIYAWIV